MNVSLTPELEGFIKQLIDEGDYLSASEVVRDSLRLLKERSEIRQMRRNEIQKEVMKGVEEIRNGNAIEYNSAEELAEDIVTRAKKAKETV